ncbi:MAG: hypothetical protein V1865_00120 [bacterium]
MPRINIKKLLLILLFFAVVILIGYLIYKIFFASQIDQELEPTDVIQTTQTGGQLPDIGEGTGIVVDDSFKPTGLDITEEIVIPASTAITRPDKVGEPKITSSIKPIVSTNGSDIQFYNKGDDRFYRIDNTGQITMLSDKKFYDVSNITWSPNKNKAILEYPDDRKVIYNFETDEQISLPKHWEDFAFSPDGDQLVFKSMGLDTDNRWLAIVNSDGTKAQKIESIGINADSIIPSWSPNNQIIAMMSEGADFNHKNIYFIGLHGENFRMTTTEGRGFEPLWSPAGNRLLYSVYSSTENYLPRLWTVEAQGDNIGANRMPIDLQTWAHKCTFVNNDEAYCAVPQSLEEGAGMFPMLAAGTNDDLYKINIAYGTKSLIGKMDYDMSNLMVTEDKEYLYFTDIDNQLHRIEL